MKKIGRGKPISEAVGSLDNTIQRVRDAFWRMFANQFDISVVEVFADYVIVKEYSMPEGQYYRVPYTVEGESYSFDARESWEVVELSYVPRAMQESRGTSSRKKFVERIDGGGVTLTEAQGDGPRHLKAVGITAGVVNGNGRRYPVGVVAEAVNELRTHLHESAGQGRAMGQQVLGEAEHPSDKSGRPNLLETVIKWEAVEFDGTQVQLDGAILSTSKGRDIQALLEGGVIPGVSQRAYGESRLVKDGGRTIEEVTELHITGYDLVLEPSDPYAGVTMFESKHEGDETMGALDLSALREQYPELVRELLEEHDEKKRKELEEALQAKHAEDERVKKMLAEREKSLRQELGLKETDDLQEALKQNRERLQALELEEQKRTVAAYIDEQTKDLAYPDFLKAQLVEAVKSADPASVDAAKKVLVEKRKEYDAIMANLQLASRGFGGVGGTVLGPVLESQHGVPEFARASFELQESLIRSNHGRRWDPRKPATPNEMFAAEYLRAFDERYKRELREEAKLFQEAEQASDLSLPYSVSRAVVAEAMPILTATSIFDTGMIDTSPTYIYFETYSGETGYTGTSTSEDVTADHDDWVALDYAHITPGTVVITNSGATVTYTEGDDYVIDYGAGRIMALSGGSITDSQALKATYTYTAIRKGEMAAIERGKMTLSREVLTMAADRLATQISREAIVFSRSQMGYDAVTRTLSSLVKQIQRKIDQGLLYLGLSAALSVASNSGGTWSSSTGDLDDLVKYIGLAKVKVANRYYEPTAIVLSTTNADRLSNWDGFKRDGFPDAVLNSNGFVGRVKGLPVFESTEFSDGYILVCNRELVMHRVQVPMQIRGPFPSYDVSGGTSKIIAADQYYAEEFNGSEAPVTNKGAYVVIS